MTAQVKLSGMEFHAFHGCLEKERREGNTFMVDLEYSYDAAQASSEDDLSKAVDYSLIYAIVSREMAIPSNLLENVALRIREAVGREVKGILWVKVSISKKNPPVGGVCEWSTVSL